MSNCLANLFPNYVANVLSEMRKYVKVESHFEVGAVRKKMSLAECLLSTNVEKMTVWLQK